jgi:hypothetical protein
MGRDRSLHSSRALLGWVVRGLGTSDRERSECGTTGTHRDRWHRESRNSKLIAARTCDACKGEAAYSSLAVIALLARNGGSYGQ